MNVVVHDDPGRQAITDPIEVGEGAGDKIALRWLERGLGAMQPPGHEVGAALESPVRHVAAIHAQTHRPNIGSLGRHPEGKRRRKAPEYRAALGKDGKAEQLE